MTDHLPTWADNPEARSLLAQIKLEQPDCWFLKRWAWTNCRHPKFKGANARALRAMWEAAREAAMNANDRDLWVALADQHPDDLIEAILDGKLREQIERELRFTIDLQRKDKAA